MKSRSKKPILQVVKRDGVLHPVTRYDAEILETYTTNQLFDIQAVSERSPQHHKLYWSILNNVVKATNKWATASHLHDDLKMLCGYYRTVINKANGGVYYVPDSIAFNKMDQKEFNDFFETAMQKIAETIGYDPLDEFG
jgi:hypothetical protein|tara:strand:+ start:2142 stop:2558 length:417 start_codon:yes stop_codon:yes gene_type:complete